MRPQSSFIIVVTQLAGGSGTAGGREDEFQGGKPDRVV